ncbi:MAG: HD domain-containing protein [Proteobacteria bacterium]|nr:HD domain-containing protein [Pseudomonadota bacterium]
MEQEQAAFLRDLGGLYRARRLYPAGNDLIRRAAEKAAESLARLGRTVRIARLGEHVVVEDHTLEETPSALRGLLQDLWSRGQEAVQIEPDAGARELEEWVERLVAGGEVPLGGSIRAGVFRLDSPAPDPKLAALAAGYLSLLPGVEEAIEGLAAGKSGGLLRAEEMVRAIAARLAAGDELFRPIRELKSHDEYTFTHALNVCVLSAAMAQALGLAQERVNAVALAALSHDLGKEKVPPELLNKPGRFTPEEKVVMDRHPLNGAQMLLKLGRVDPLLPVVAYQHHRGADGRGYPDQAGGGPAHPASLLVSVADVYDALRTVRPYRPARSAEVAFNVLLGDARRGHLHGAYVSAFAGLLGLLEPGRRVQLGDGRAAVVVERGTQDSLRPVLLTDGGGTVDLLKARESWIEAVAEEPGAAESVTATGCSPGGVFAGPGPVPEAPLGASPGL